MVRNFQDMLETPFPFFISKKVGEIPIFGTFLAKMKNEQLFFLINRKKRKSTISKSYFFAELKTNPP